MPLFSRFCGILLGCVFLVTIQADQVCERTPGVTGPPACNCTSVGSKSMITRCSEEFSTLCKRNGGHGKLIVRRSKAYGFESNAVQQCDSLKKLIRIRLYNASIEDFTTFRLPIEHARFFDSYVGNISHWLVSKWLTRMTLLLITNVSSNTELLEPSSKSFRPHCIDLRNLFSMNVNPAAFMDTSNGDAYYEWIINLENVKVRGPQFFHVPVKPNPAHVRWSLRTFKFVYRPLYDLGVEKSYPVFYPVKQEGKVMPRTTLVFSGNFGRRWPRRILERFSHIDNLVISASVEQIEFGSFGLEKFIASNFAFLESDWDENVKTQLISAACQESWKRGNCSKLMEDCETEPLNVLMCMVCYMQNYGLHKTKDKVREKCERKENFEGNRLNCWETPFEKVPVELAGVEGIQDSPLINEGFPQCPEETTMNAEVTETTMNAEVTEATSKSTTGEATSNNTAEVDKAAGINKQTSIAPWNLPWTREQLEIKFIDASSGSQILSGVWFLLFTAPNACLADSGFYM